MPPQRSKKASRPSKVTREEEEEAQHAQQDQEDEPEHVQEPQAEKEKEAGKKFKKPLGLPPDPPLPAMPDLPLREKVTMEVHREEEAHSDTPTVEPAGREEEASNISTKSEEDEPKKKRFCQPNLNLEEHVEEELLEWYRENECFYNKKLRTYKEGEYKRKLMEDKAKELGIT